MHKLLTTPENHLLRACYRNEFDSDVDEDSLEAGRTSKVCDHDATNLL